MLLITARSQAGTSAARDFVLAVALSIGFMFATTIQSAATLAYRANATDTMRAATQGAWSGRIGREIAYFVCAQLLLHVAFAVVVWLLVSGRVTYQLALLMLVAMLGLYVGLGVLFAVYRFIDKLE